MQLAKVKMLNRSIVYTVHVGPLFIGTQLHVGMDKSNPLLTNWSPQNAVNDEHRVYNWSWCVY